MTDEDIDGMVQHLVLNWNDDLASLIGSNYIVSSSEKEFEVLESILSG